MKEKQKLPEVGGAGASGITVAVELEQVREMLGLTELFLKKWMETERARLLLEEKERKDREPGFWERRGCAVLVVDDDPQTARALRESFSEESDYMIVSAQNSGEALDYGAQQPFHFALIKESLPDLPGSMVAKSMRQQSAESAVLLFSRPDRGPGQLILSEQKERLIVISELTSPGQLAEALRSLRDAFITKASEKMFLDSFRKEHLALLKRYAALRQKFVTFVSDGTK